MGVSTVLVMGGSGDYFEVADQVILMDAFRPEEATRRARQIAAQHPTLRRCEAAVRFEPGQTLLRRLILHAST